MAYAVVVAVAVRGSSLPTVPFYSYFALYMAAAINRIGADTYSIGTAVSILITFQQLALTLEVLQLLLSSILMLCWHRGCSIRN